MNELAVIFDVETGGVDWQTDGIVQFSAVAYNPQMGHSYTLMSTYCNSGLPIAPEAEETHGISEDMLRFSPPVKLVMIQFREMLRLLNSKYKVVLAGHNSEKFDAPMCDRFCPSAKLLEYPHIDTLLLARRHFPDAENHKLGHMLATYVYDCDESELEGAHDAAYDCSLVADMLPIFFEKEGVSSLLDLARASATPRIYDRMPFGKWKGKALADVPISYLDFCYRKFDNMDRDMRASFEHRLNIKPEVA